VNDDQREAYSAYVSQRWRVLVRAAVVLGCDLHAAQDLAQATLLRCYVKWPQVEVADNRDAYVARVMLNLHRQARRRRWRAERPTAELPEPTRVAEPDDGTDTVAEALARLSPEQREVVVLRILMELSEREVAGMLRIPAGTVKSRLSRALARLALDPELMDLDEGGWR
jgi:RNA polymerase sigma-70 factor (sigma-E family)